MKKLVLALFLVLVALPSVADAHETREYVINGVQYAITVGSLGEPVVVDDKTGTDLTITRWGVPFVGAETLLKVEVGSGDVKKTFDLATVYGTEGKYKTTFFITKSDPLSYRLVGTLEGKPIDLLFTCAPSGHNMAAMGANTARETISEGVIRTLQRGGFGCPAPKSEYEFPQASSDQVTLAYTVVSAKKTGGMGLAFGVASIVIALGALFVRAEKNDMKMKVVVIIVAILLGLLSCFVFGGSFSSTSKQKVTEEVKTQESMPMNHAMHPMLEVDASKPVPSVTVKAVKDSMDGYNIEVVTKDFTFTPEKTGGAPESNTGHAHLYVNGTKVARLYGAWFNLSGKVLMDGKNTIQVTLNANDHSEWAKDGQHIAAETVVTK